MEDDQSKYNGHLFKYKDIHKDGEAVVLATGPSLTKYKLIEKNNAIIAGVNGIYNYTQFVEKLNYYFFGSHYEIDSNHKEKVNSLDEKIIKFASVYRDGVPTGFGNITPENAEKINAIPFECGLVNFTNDIAGYKMLGHSIIFPTLQFLLYTGVKKINVVGCDIIGFYDSNNEAHLKEWWEKFKIWIASAYPEVEIIIINPVGLKGIFKDEECL